MRICLYLLVAGLFFSCSKAGSSYIPDLGANWENTSANNHDIYSFNVVDWGGIISDFVGAESVNYSEVYTFSGNYKNAAIQFTFTSGPKTGTKYSGTITGSGNDGIITLNTPTGKIVLTR